MSSVICGGLFIVVLMVCQPMPAGAQSNGDLRVVSNGQVEIYQNTAKWQGICSTGWDGKDAKVVCRQLKKDTYFVEAGSVAVSNTTGVWLYQLDCVGNETRLTNCSSTDLTTCCSFAAVTCGSLFSGLSTPVIAGIAAGSLVLLGIVAGSIVGWIKCKDNVNV